MRLQLLPALAYLPLLLLLLHFFRRRGAPRAQTFTGPFDLPGAAGPGSGAADVLTVLGLVLLSVVLARPQRGFERLPEPGEGVDIVITLDVSGSMMQEDYHPTRLEAAKRAAMTFVRGRPNDRVGLVVYAGLPRTVCPPTLDHETLGRFVKASDLGSLEDGTAIGAGLAVAARGLDYSRTERRVIVLISDGEDTARQMDPVTVAQAISTLHGDSLRVYTIAIGTPSSQEGYGVDRQTLSDIARICGGSLFSVESEEELSGVYAAIDSLEASTLPEEGLFVYRDRYLPFLAAGLLLVALGGLLKWRLLRVVGE